MIKIIVYAGLSLPFDEAKSILDSDEDVEVIYKRPIQRGDLKQALKEHLTSLQLLTVFFIKTPL